MKKSWMNMPCILCFRTCLFIVLLALQVFASSSDSTVSFRNVHAFENDEFPFSVSAVSDSSVWFATNNGVYHFDGTETTRHLTPDRFSASFVEQMSISAVNDSNVWVLGHDPKTWDKTVFKYDGRQWKKLDFPQALDTPDDDLVIFRLHMFNSDDGIHGYAIGQNGLIYFYDGSDWQAKPIFTQSTLRAFCFVRENLIFAGGTRGAIYRFDGYSWQPMPVGGTDVSNTIINIAYCSDDDIWAAGTRQLWHFNGNKWQPFPSPVSGYLRDVQAVSKTDAWLISFSGDVLRFDGETWNYMAKFENQTMSTMQGSQLLHTSEGNHLWFITTGGLHRSINEKIPTFTDVSGFTNLHLNGGIFIPADLDNNGTVDLIQMMAQGLPARIYSNRGDGFFFDRSASLPGLNTTRINAIVPADIDNDGNLDLYIQAYPQNDYWYQNQGAWTFRIRQSPVHESRQSERAGISFDDMDNDGDLDLTHYSAVIDTTVFPITIWYNNGVGEFIDSVSFGDFIPAQTASGHLTISDLNHDFLPDIIATVLTHRTYVYINQGSGLFEEQAQNIGLSGLNVNPIPYINATIVRDLNADCRPDILQAFRGGILSVNLNDGKGRFSESQRIYARTPSGFVDNIDLADINVDGLVDFALQDSLYSFQQNKFLPINSGIRLPAGRNIQFVDFDKDGDQDIFIKNKRWYVYRNELNPEHVVRVKVSGTKSNSSAMGSRLRVVDKKSQQASSATFVNSTLPHPVTTKKNVRHEIVIEFPSGRKVTESLPASGLLEIGEYSPATLPFVALYYSFRRSLLIASPPVEGLKFVFIFLVVTGLWIMARRWQVSREIAHPSFLTALFALYIVLFHLFIRSELWLVRASPALTIAAISILLALRGIKVKSRKEQQYIGHYQLLERLGSGGMGTVFKARDTREDINVAIKVLNEALLSDPENRRRLASEGHLLSSFDHPNIVKVYQVGEHNGRAFIAMEILTGGTLQEYLAANPELTLAQKVEVFREICAGLAEIHRNGIIHRDIKTGNIMLNDKQQVRIMDFGLSKSSLVTTMSATGSVLGTLGFVAPEQITGVEVDQRADIFSLGVIAYEMFTGKLPFHGENEMALIHAIFNTVPKSPISVNKDITKHMNSLILRCLEKNPARRFESVCKIEECLAQFKQ